jgi:hypothetical protein
MILIDFSQVVVGGVVVNFRGDEVTQSDSTRGLIRHMVLNSLLSFRKQFKTYGEMVICCDSDKYWRRDYFPFYKGDRKRMRDTSTIDWKFLHNFKNELMEEIRENFMYPVIQTSGAEADDVIAALCKWSQDNDLTEGLFDAEPKPIMIVSEDMDFFQLQKYKNVKQYAPRKKKQIVPEIPLKHFIIEHIVKAGDDAIPNILSADNCIAEQVRQTAVKRAYLDEFLKHGEGACTTDTERRNWKRNQTLIDFDYIPEEITSAIIAEYIGYEKTGSRNKIMSYLIKNRCKQLIGDLGEF